jgi:hypothetical protein
MDFLKIFYVNVMYGAGAFYLFLLCQLLSCIVFILDHVVEAAGHYFMQRQHASLSRLCN